MSASERVQLAGAPMLVGIAFAFGGLLAAVLPTRQEYANQANLKPDAQSASYLSVLTRGSPGDEELRRLYVRHLAALGQFDAAIEALGPAPAAPSDPEAANLHFDLRLARARALPEPSVERTQAFASVVEDLRDLRTVPLPAARLRELAGLALELEQPHLAAEYLLGLSRLSPVSERAAVLASAGRWLRAAGDGEKAAECYEQAAAVEAEPAQSRADTMSAVDALEAQNEVSAAANLEASFAAAHPDDLEAAERSAVLAASANRMVASRDWGRKVLALRPDDPVQIERQVRRELAVGDSRAALPLMRRLVGLHPDDVAWHRAEARVAEWGGDPATALEDWLWLLGRGVEPSPEFALP